MSFDLIHRSRKHNGVVVICRDHFAVALFVFGRDRVVAKDACLQQELSGLGVQIHEPVVGLEAKRYVRFDFQIERVALFAAIGKAGQIKRRRRRAYGAGCVWCADGGRRTGSAGWSF